MAIIEILENLFFVERGYLNSNHFVYRSKEPVLIDSGYISDFEETARILKGLDIKLSQVRLIISTHCHCDHIGGNKIIQDQSGCDIALHEIGKSFIDTRDNWSTWWRYYNQKADFFDCTIGLEDKDSITIGPYHFEVIHTPGHASDGIVLYNRKEKLLISSDTLWEKDMAVHTIRVEGNAAVFYTKNSLIKLANLEVNHVYPGHGNPFKDFKGALARSMRKANDYLKSREKIGTDVLKKITVYTLLMNRTVAEKTFFAELMKTHWFKETIDFYFNGEYEAKYNETLNDLLHKNVLRRENGTLYTTVKP
jgi:glyoxylase-like metal-dependent hydrolase (beta-lactamase superfamily II)